MLKLYLNAWAQDFATLREQAIERVTGVCHNTVINWVKQVSQALADEDYEIAETIQLDELHSCRT